MVRIADGEAGLSAATIRRRLAAVSSFYGYLITRGDVGVESNPVPRGLPTRRSRHRKELRGQPLVREVRRLPCILDPEELAALMVALRTERDRAMVQAMALGGLRRCEVIGLRLEDLRLGEWRVFVAEGKGGHQRFVPVSPSFFATVASYMNNERPVNAPTDRLFVVLKGPRRGRPLSIEGLDEIISGARARAGLAHGTCHELRHTCLTRLRGAGHVLGGSAGSGRASLHRVHSGVSASGVGLAGRRIPPGGRGDRRPSGGGDGPMSAATVVVGEPELVLPGKWAEIAEPGTASGRDHDRLSGPALSATGAGECRHGRGQSAPVRRSPRRHRSLLPVRSRRHGVSCGQVVRRGGRTGVDRSDDQLQAECTAALLRTRLRIGPWRRAV